MAESESYYEYVPSVAAAVVFVVLFIILAFYHLFRTFRTRTWFCIPFSVGAILEIIGYLCRALGNNKPNALLPYIIQSLFILLAPILFAASVYMFLARIILATNTVHYSIIRITRITKIFVGGDILCFLIQAGGGGILAGSDNKSSSDLGKGVILAGLCLQMVIFAFFMVVAAVWQMRMRGSNEAASKSFNWLIYLNMLYIVSILITLRNLFRVIEYAMGSEGYLLANEWPIYAFDAALMVVVLAICDRWYIQDEMAAAQYQETHMETLGQSDLSA
ncbi:RTA1 domain-containing protein [Stagonosporopsis vannaccii]|nr:RTA1 domain-containing protein [Stagonosporopsis vannaccii]